MQALCRFGLQYQSGKRWQGKFNGMLTSHPGHRFTVQQAAIAHIAAAIAFGITIDQLAIAACLRNTNPVLHARHWGEVEQDNQSFARLARTYKADRGLLGIVAVNPVCSKSSACKAG